MQKGTCSKNAGYYAVIFTSTLSDTTEGYRHTADRMIELAMQQPGFLGIESAREEIGISVSYWQDLASIHQWKQQVEHQQAQRMGIESWYQHFRLRIAKVEKDYEFSR